MSVVNFSFKSTKSLEGTVSAAEWETRLALAACYRLLAHTGVWDMTYNHLSARIPDAPNHYLIKGERQLFSQVTASSLVKYDLDGAKLTETPHSVSRGGLVIHAGVLEARSDINAVFHTHTEASMAVSAQKIGLLPITQHALRFYGFIAYHDFGGFEFDLDGRKRLNDDLAGKYVMIMRNHGALVTGRTIAEAYVEHHFLEYACRAQIGALAAGGIDGLIIPSDEVASHAAQQIRSRGPETEQGRDWGAMIELIDSIDDSYRV